MKFSALAQLSSHRPVLLLGVALLWAGRPSMGAMQIQLELQLLPAPVVTLSAPTGIVSQVLTDPALCASWQADVAVMRERILASNPWLDALARADIAVAVSGGDSFSDIYGLGRFFYMVLPQWLVLLLDRPLVLLPQTLTVFHDYEHAVLGLLIMLFMIFLRMGIVPGIAALLRRRR